MIKFNVRAKILDSLRFSSHNNNSETTLGKSLRQSPWPLVI
ncbi:MAG TPA: hypothetical protein VGS16_11445 [Candidatus Dormibacteraeota bacterium]|nr:hypothetical protein [Candidatus Dormibacteraeota bacterium]